MSRSSAQSAHTLRDSAYAQANIDPHAVRQVDTTFRRHARDIIARAVSEASDIARFMGMGDTRKYTEDTLYFIEARFVRANSQAILRDDPNMISLPIDPTNHSLHHLFEIAQRADRWAQGPIRTRLYTIFLRTLERFFTASEKPRMARHLQEIIVRHLDESKSTDVARIIRG